MNLNTFTVWKFEELESAQTIIGPLNKNIHLLALELGVKIEYINDMLIMEDTEENHQKEAFSIKGLLVQAVHIASSKDLCYDPNGDTCGIKTEKTKQNQSL